MAIRTAFTVRIVYKSGYTHDFDTYEFTYGNGKYTWEACEGTNAPLFLGPDYIESVWIVGKKAVTVPGSK